MFFLDSNFGRRSRTNNCLANKYFSLPNSLLLLLNILLLSFIKSNKAYYSTGLVIKLLKSTVNRCVKLYFTFYFYFYQKETFFYCYQKKVHKIFLKIFERKKIKQAIYKYNFPAINNLEIILAYISTFKNI